ncbi:ExbD/TolR family protein [Odoribacter laneus]|jgi:putative tansport related protein|nr:biopolymer transporter ExbD [Odoribacter laneus]MBS1445046.1 biopolymer transporter ExbD [Odoribacter sp.]
MAIQRKSKINPHFNMSSMTDIVFLLLIFFLVTSTLVNPNALKLLLPKSTNQLPSQQSVTVSIDKNLVYYFNAKVTPFSMLESKIVSELKNSADPCINIQAEKSVPIEYVVRIMNIAKTHGYKSILATEPE